MKDRISVVTAAHVLSLFIVTIQARILLQQEECFDVTPDEQYTCQQQFEWGKCSEGWLIQGQYCRKTCGACAPSQQSYQTYQNQQPELPPKQCRLNNCTLIDYYGENPFKQAGSQGGSATGRRLSQQEENKEVAKANFFSYPVLFQPVEVSLPLQNSHFHHHHSFDIVQLEGAYDSFKFPAITLKQKEYQERQPVVLKITEENNTNKDNLSIFIPPPKESNSSNNIPAASPTSSQDKLKAQAIPIPSASPSSSPSPTPTPSPSPTPTPTTSPSPILIPSPTTTPTSSPSPILIPSPSPSPSPQGGVVAFSLDQSSSQQEVDNQEDFPGLSLLYDVDSAVLDPGSQGAILQQGALMDVARAAVARLELDRLQPECLDDIKKVLVDPCCPQYVVQQGEQICDIASASGIDCQQLKDFNDVTDVKPGQIIQVC